MKIAKELAKEAKKKGICESWHGELKTLDNKKAMVAMYVKGIDFCLSNEYPSNEYIRANFKGVMEDFGVFLDDNINLVNFRRCISLGATKGRVEIASYGVCEVFAKHDSELRIIAKDNAFVEVDIFDNAIIYVHAQDRAKVHINRYGGKIIADPIAIGDSAMVKIIEKHKKHIEMEANNIILNLPFDESDGSQIAYDYSQNRADGQVVGAHFVTGKNGNAIKFSGEDTCEVSKNVISNMAMEFSMLMWVQSSEILCGSPQKLIWLLNFSGLNNFAEVPIEAKPGTWFYLAITRRGSIFNFYVNSSLIKSVTNTGTLKGLSLNQDYYGGSFGLGMLDDVKFYNVALTQSDIIQELSSSKKQAYTLDGVDFKEYGVYVSDSDGVVSRPKLKDMAKVSWDNYHGESVDLQHKFYEPREITLSCFIKAKSKNDFITMISRFEQLFDKPGTNRLTIDVHPIKPLIYEVYCKDEISVAKKWNDELMVGTFKLKLIEPEPLKRILKHIRIGESTKTCTITLTTTKLINIYWGDGAFDFDVFGDNKTITHEYAQNGDYFPVITGCIDEISSFTTNAIVVWSKL